MVVEDRKSTTKPTTNQSELIVLDLNFCEQKGDKTKQKHDWVEGSEKVKALDVFGHFHLGGGELRR